MLDIVCPQVFDLAIQWIPSGGRRLRVLRMRRSPCAVANAESDGASNSATLTYRHYPQHRFRPRSGIRWTGGAPNPATAHLPRDTPVVPPPTLHVVPRRVMRLRKPPGD